MATFTVPPAVLKPGAHAFGPFAVPPGTARVVALGTLSDADAGDPSNQVSVAVGGSFDGGSTYRPLASVDWQGGPAKDGVSPPPRPGFELTFDPRLVPDHLSLTITLGKALSVGVAVTTS
jgi:hypothetical protein